jgi:hypothetical protein
MFVIVMGCVFFEVLTEFLNIIQTNLGFKGSINNTMFRRLISATVFRQQPTLLGAIDISVFFALSVIVVIVFILKLA